MHVGHYLNNSFIQVDIV